MQYDLTTPLVDHDGNAAVENGVNITAKIALIKALLSEGVASVEEKMKRFELFLKIKAAEVVELATEEVALLHKAVEVFPVLVMGQLKHFLDQKT
jgi:hypothetical protein